MIASTVLDVRSKQAKFAHTTVAKFAYKTVYKTPSTGSPEAPFKKRYIRRKHPAGKLKLSASFNRVPKPVTSVSTPDFQFERYLQQRLLIVLSRDSSTIYR